MRQRPNNDVTAKLLLAILLVLAVSFFVVLGILVKEFAVNNRMKEPKNVKPALAKSTDSAEEEAEMNSKSETVESESTAMASGNSVISFSILEEALALDTSTEAALEVTETASEEKTEEEEVPVIDPEELPEEAPSPSLSGMDGEYVWEGILTEELTEELFIAIRQANTREFPGDRSVAQMMIDDLFAYYGMSFGNGPLGQYYQEKSWYNGDTDYEGAVSRMLRNDLHYRNMRMLRKMEDTQPFYSIFCGPFASWSEAKYAISGRLENNPMLATDWSELEGEGYYASLGGYDSREAAERNLNYVYNPGGYSCFVSYSGEFVGTYVEK